MITFSPRTLAAVGAAMFLEEKDRGVATPGKGDPEEYMRRARVVLADPNVQICLAIAVLDEAQKQKGASR